MVLPKLVARQLRRNQTDAESILWNALRDRRLIGRKFLRQYPIKFKYDNRKRFFVADFYCNEARLVVEVDGGIHEKQKDYDILRDHIINFLGFNIIRFKNNQVKFNLKAVLDAIIQKIGQFTP